MSSNNWTSFWKKPNVAFNRVMQVSTDYFFHELMKSYPLKPRESVLDYGCGPGFLVSDLINAGVKVTGADINEFFIEQNKSRYPETEFVLLPSTINGKFDEIVLLSIVQYFSSADEVGNTISSLKANLKPNGRLILADVIDGSTSSVRDAIGIFIQCIKRGRIVAFAKFILYLLFSNYSKTSKQNKLLFLSPDLMKQIADRNSLSLSEQRGMTPHPTRRNYILTQNG